MLSIKRRTNEAIAIDDTVVQVAEIRGDHVLLAFPSLGDGVHVRRLENPRGVFAPNDVPTVWGPVPDEREELWMRWQFERDFARS